MAVDTYKLIDRCEGLRVTDICDGMDAVGLWDVGLVSRDIRPLWRDTENFQHRVYGVAHTVKFLPTNNPREPRSPDEFYTWMSDWYRNMARGPINDEIKKGDIIVIDGDECGSVGFAGSANSLSWIVAGAVGVVTNGGCRDTDELIKQRIPVYSRYINRTIRPGRLELGGTNVTVNIGGAMVNPGDLVVADGDGSVVVSADKAEAVINEAWRHAEKDKAGRKKLYEAAGLEPDFTVAV